MKKKNIVVGAVLASLVAGLALTAAAAYDSSSDPLITLSYLRDVFKVELMNEVDEKLAGYTPSSGNSTETTPAETEPEAETPEATQNAEPSENYEYLAFEWVDAHVIELNERCNESIARGLSVLEIPAAELPARESWSDICRELEHNGMENCCCTETGITIDFTQ